MRLIWDEVRSQWHLDICHADLWRVISRCSKCATSRSRTVDSLEWTYTNCTSWDIFRYSARSRGTSTISLTSFGATQAMFDSVNIEYERVNDMALASRLLCPPTPPRRHRCCLQSGDCRCLSPHHRLRDFPVYRSFLRPHLPASPSPLTFRITLVTTAALGACAETRTGQVVLTSSLSFPPSHALVTISTAPSSPATISSPRSSIPNWSSLALQRLAAKGR